MKARTQNISYTVSAAAVVFGVHLSVFLAFGEIDLKSPAPDIHRGPFLRVDNYIVGNTKGLCNWVNI